MKLIFLTDTHIRANSPSSRKDDFSATILNKLRWVGKIANELKVDGIIHGGDWLDRPDLSYKMLRELFIVLREWNKPIYTVLGNHDIYGYNPETFGRTALSLLESVGIIKRLSLEPVVLNNSVSLTGVDAHYNLDKEDKSDYLKVPGDSKYLKIHVVHGFLAKHKWPKVPCTLVDEILDTEADIILTGHEHSGFGKEEYSNKIFCNPGSLARVTAGVGDISQVVKIGLISYDNKTSSYDIELINLPKDIAKPAEEVLDREKLLEEKEHKKQLSEFSNNLSNFKFNNEFNVFTILSELAEQENLDKTVVDIIKKKLQEAEQEISRG